LIEFGPGHVKRHDTATGGVTGPRFAHPYGTLNLIDKADYVNADGRLCEHVLADELRWGGAVAASIRPEEIVRRLDFARQAAPTPHHSRADPCPQLDLCMIPSATRS